MKTLEEMAREISRKCVDDWCMKFTLTQRMTTTAMRWLIDRFADKLREVERETIERCARVADRQHQLDTAEQSRVDSDKAYGALAVAKQSCRFIANDIRALLPPTGAGAKEDET